MITSILQFACFTLQGLVILTYCKAFLVCLFVTQQIRREKIREEIKLTRLCAFSVGLRNTSSTWEISRNRLKSFPCLKTIHFETFCYIEDCSVANCFKMYWYFTLTFLHYYALFEGAFSIGLTKLISTVWFSISNI